MKLQPKPKRPTHFYDLPTELILRIFELARGGRIHPDHDPFAEEWEDANLDLDTVKSLRLTSRLFCNTSSELLLRRLDVTLSVESLEHVERVAQNPLIARGICAIRLNLDCYFGSLSARQKFFKHVEVVLLQHLRGFWEYLQYVNDLDDIDPGDRDPEREAWFESNGLTLDPPLSKRRIEHMQRRLSHFFVAVSNLLHLDMDHHWDIDPRARSIRQAMKQGLWHYQRLLWEQTRVFLDNRLVRVLADNIAKMPRARRLLITDDQRHLGSRHHHHPWPDMLDDADLLFHKEILRPRRWSEWGPLVTEQDREAGGPFSTFLLHALPIQLSEKGHSLRHLDIQLSATDRMDWRLKSQQLAALRISADSLQMFRCHIGIPWSEGLPGQQDPAPVKFLEAYASGRRLEIYDVAMTRAPERPLVGMCFAPLLIELQSPNLREIRIRGCVFDITEINAALIQHGIKLDRLCISRLTLKYASIASGTLEQAAALLKRLATLYSLRGRVSKPHEHGQHFCTPFPLLKSL